MRHATLMLAAIAMAVGLCPGLGSLLEFDRQRIGDGEIWRLLTCHLTHWSLRHLFWDGLSLVALGWVVGRMERAGEFLLVLGALVSCTVLFATDLQHYRGLSGYCVALYVLALARFSAEAAADGNDGRVAWCVAGLLVLAGKTVVETWIGHGLFVGADGGGYVYAPWSHLAGVGGALVWTGVIRSRRVLAVAPKQS